MYSNITVYEGVLSDEVGVPMEERSAILTAQAMAAFANNDRHLCKTLLFNSYAHSLLSHYCSYHCHSSWQIPDLTSVPSGPGCYVRTRLPWQWPHIVASCLGRDPQAIG